MPELDFFLKISYFALTQSLIPQYRGGVSEWSNEPDSKSGVLERVP